MYDVARLNVVLCVKHLHDAAQGQESLGRRVSQLQLDTSPHVQHLRYHREVYCKALTSFLNKLQLPTKRKLDKVCPLSDNLLHRCAEPACEH